MDDERIGTLLVDAVRTLPAPTEKIVSGAIERGRRRQRIVRIGETLSVVGVLAGVVGLVVALLPGNSASGTMTPAGASPDPTPPSQPTVTITPQALLQTALDTLPRPGDTSRYAGEFMGGFVGTQFVYDDGTGAAKVLVSLNYPPLGDGLGAACQISVCTTRPDGSKLAVYQGNGHPGDPSIPGKDWEVTLLRTDGVAVSITEWNAAQEKGSPVTRTDPPFTVDELTTWVESDKWQAQISADEAQAAADLFQPVDENEPGPSSQPDQQCQVVAKEEKGQDVSARRLAVLRERARQLGC
jgi:hypothetical protein